MMQFSEEQLRDSPYGYNDELAYAILDETVNAGQYVLGHIDNFNFSGGLQIYTSYFHHEFTHILLGLSSLKHGKNPFPFEYGYDGNYMAETLVLEAQEYFTNIYFETIHLDREKFINQITAKYSWDNEFTDIKNAVQAVELMHHEQRHGLTRVFDARRKFHFDNDEMIQKKDTTSLIMQCQDGQFGNQLYLGQNMSEDVIGQFFDNFQPIIKLVGRNYRRLIEDRNLDVINNHETLRDYLKAIPVHVLWDVMNNPELAETIDLDHRKTLTWEFCMKHERSMNLFFECMGIPIRKVRSHLIEKKPRNISCAYDQCSMMACQLNSLLELKDDIYLKKRKQIAPFRRRKICTELTLWQQEFAINIGIALVHRGTENIRAHMILQSGRPIGKEKNPTPSP